MKKKGKKKKKKKLVKIFSKQNKTKQNKTQTKKNKQTKTKTKTKNQTKKISVFVVYNLYNDLQKITKTEVVGVQKLNWLIFLCLRNAYSLR